MNDDDFDAMIEDFGYVIWDDQFHNTELAALTAEEIVFLADRGARFEEMWEELETHASAMSKRIMKTLKKQYFSEGS